MCVCLSPNFFSFLKYYKCFKSKTTLTGSTSVLKFKVVMVTPKHRTDTLNFINTLWSKQKLPRYIPRLFKCVFWVIPILVYHYIYFLISYFDNLRFTFLKGFSLISNKFKVLNVLLKFSHFLFLKLYFVWNFIGQK